jgi:hypothetical protein
MQIAALCDFEQYTARLLLVLGAQAAIVGTALPYFGKGIFGIRGGLGAHPGREGWLPAPDNSAKITVLRAGFFKIDILAVFRAGTGTASQHNHGGDTIQTLWANTFGGRENLAHSSSPERS